MQPLNVHIYPVKNFLHVIRFTGCSGSEINLIEKSEIGMTNIFGVCNVKTTLYVQNLLKETVQFYFLHRLRLCRVNQVLVRIVTIVLLRFLTK